MSIDDLNHDELMDRMEWNKKMAKGILTALSEKGLTPEQMCSALALAWGMFAKITMDNHEDFMDITKVTSRVVGLRGYPYTDQERDSIALYNLMHGDNDG